MIFASAASFACCRQRRTLPRATGGFAESLKITHE